MTEQTIMVEVGSGELIDKITILEIKSERISDAEKLDNIRHELAILSDARNAKLLGFDGIEQLTAELKEINSALWDIEDDIRACEAAKDFGDKFIALARAVYVTNDKRAAVKKQINLLTGAAIVEEKSYTDFA